MSTNSNNAASAICGAVEALSTTDRQSMQKTLQAWMAAEEPYWGGGDGSNAHTEAISFAPVLVSSSGTQVSDTTGDPSSLYLARYAGAQSVFEVTNDHKVHVKITTLDTAGDFWGTNQSGPCVSSSLYPYRIPRTTSSTLVLKATVSWTGHTNIATPGIPAVRSGIVINGTGVGSPTFTADPQSCCLVLERNGGIGGQFYRGVSTQGGVASDFGRTSVSDSWFTSGTDLRLILSATGAMSAAVKQSSSDTWTSLSGAFRSPGFTPSSFGFFVGFFGPVSLSGDVDVYLSGMSLQVT